MISILIPVFNRDVVKLVLTLAEQLKRLKNLSEIIVLDDGSDIACKEVNRKLAEIAYVSYQELPSNIGRIRIRQQLAETANFDWLLFLDGDSTVVSDTFLTTYIDAIADNNKVIVGGRNYALQQPADCRYMLHWKYGSDREVARFNDQRHTNRFMTNNFLINKSIFQTFDFASGWNGYGYEDTWMAIQLDTMNLPVKFINNPVIHDGVVTCSEFIMKSREALKNLKILSNLTSPEMLSKHVKLFQYYHHLKSLKLLWILGLSNTILERIVKKNLCSCNPSLAMFDLYRLTYYLKVDKTL